MKRPKRLLIIAAIISGAALLSLVGLKLWLANSPLIVMGPNAPGGELFDSRTAVGRVFMDVQACGEQQKNLYQCIEIYQERTGRLPKDKNELINEVNEAMAFDDCPTRLTWYVIHFENFGNPQAVLIEEAKNKHRTTFKLWARGIKPQVQTMGDGTVQLFADGKVATINAAREKK